MIQVRLTTPEDRTNKLTDPSTTVKDFLDTNAIELTGASVSLDGITLSLSELNSSFTDNFVEQTCRLTVTVKSDNG